MLSTYEIWKKMGDEIYFFILKRVKDKNIANDVFQEVFLKIHANIGSLQQEGKLKSWAFQIVRNEIANYFNKENKYIDFEENKYIDFEENKAEINEEIINYCCFDEFLNELSHPYKEVMELVYVEGKKQGEVSEILGITLANVKIRIKRAKESLKQKLQECCHYEVDKEGNSVGEPNCNCNCCE